METTEGTYAEKRGESSLRSVMSMVQVVASKMMPGMEAAARPPTPPAANQRVDKSVSAALVQLGVADQGTLDLPFSKQKAFLSLASSMAAGMRSPVMNPDADKKNGSGG